MADILRGRPPFIIAPLSAFTVGVNGNPPIQPYDREFVYDDLGDQSVGFIKFENESWVFKSVSQDLNTFISNLKSTGLFDNAASGVVSKELNYFLYNNITKSIIFNSKLVFPDTFAYYAIRKGTKYITGVEINGIMINAVDMIAIEQPVGSDNYIRKPKNGILAPDASLMDGDPCIVEFFDVSRRLIGREVFYAEYASTFTGDTSDTAIASLNVVTTRPGVDADSAILYRGENIDQLKYSMILLYNNGDTKDVTHEISNIEINGLNTIDTSNVTGDNPYVVTFTYNPPNNSLAVSKTINVSIISDETAEVLDMIPVYYFTNATLASLVRRYFAVMSNHSFYEITSKLAADQPVGHDVPTVTGTAGVIKTTLNLGLHDQTPTEFEYAIRFISSNGLKADKSAILNPFNGEYRRITINGSSLSIDGTIIAANLSSGSIIPTHFRVRTLNGVAVSNHTLITSYNNFPRLNNTATIVSDKITPVIIEFSRITGTVGSADYSVEITKCLVAYFN